MARPPAGPSRRGSEPEPFPRAVRRTPAPEARHHGSPPSIQGEHLNSPMPGPSSLRLSMTAMPSSPSPPCRRASTTSAPLRAGDNHNASAALRGREIHGLHAASCSRDQNASPTPLGRRQRHRPGFSCHNGPCTPRSAVSHSICAGGNLGGDSLTGSRNQRSPPPDAGSSNASALVPERS